MSELAVVTGASGGLGLEFAKQLAAEGYNLVLIARSADKLEANASNLRTLYNVSVETIAADLSVVGAAENIFVRVPQCDVLVNNAGFASNGRFDMLPEERIREEIVLDVLTLTELTRKYLPGMRARRRGRILNVASTAAFVPGPFMAVYYAAKAYVMSFSEAIAEEVRGSGVSVTCLCPGPTATGFQDRAGVQRTLLFRLGLADASSVAKAGIRGMMQGKTVVVPGIMNKLVAFSPRISPRRLLLFISRILAEAPR
jgi:short-subunit dehydrogenase